MATSADVQKYIESRLSTWGEGQLQKLVYYAQAWSLAWDGKPLFNERIEAWQRGPVAPDLWRRWSPSTIEGLSDAEKATVDAIVDFYGDMPGTVLSQRTHDEAPWKDAWGDRPASASGSDEITRDAMRRFYTSEALAGRAPSRRSLAGAPAETDRVLARSAENAERWHDALQLLAQ